MSAPVVFLDTVTGHFADVTGADTAEPGEREPDHAGMAAALRLVEDYDLGQANLVKPGVGETTRVLLRRVPWKILCRADAGDELAHVRLLAAQRGVPVEEVAELPYSCVGLIHPRFTRGAVGAAGTTAAGTTAAGTTAAGAAR